MRFLFLFVVLFSLFLPVQSKTVDDLTLYPIYKKYIIAIHNGDWNEAKKHLSCEIVKRITQDGVTPQSAINMVKDLIPKIGEPVGIKEKIKKNEGKLYLSRKRKKTKGEITFVKEKKMWKIASEDWDVKL